MSLVSFLQYNLTGKIVLAGRNFEQFLPLLSITDGFESLRNDEIFANYYVSITFDGHGTTEANILQAVLTPRPSMGIVQQQSSVAANGIEPCTITDIPVGTTLTSEYGSFIITDGSASITFTTVGLHTLKFTLFPYLDTTVYVTAT
jgi:hypothetical protein